MVSECLWNFYQLVNNTVCRSIARDAMFQLAESYHSQVLCCDLQVNVYSIIIISALFVNNISGYAKFPITCFLDIYPKNLQLSTQIFFR